MKIIIFALRYFYHLIFTSFYHLGKKVAFDSGVNILEGEYISLGDNVYLGNNVLLQAPKGHLQYSFKKPKLKIENRVTIGLSTMISAAKFIHIKKNVLIAQYCFIGDHDHEYRDINIPIRDQGLTNIKSIIIEEGAWIGANVTVCSGVTIGKNAVIGANSVVKSDIPAYSVAVGVPARVIKKYNPEINVWERINKN